MTAPLPAQLPGTTTGDLLLQVRDLRVEFSTPHGPARAVRGLDLDVHAGEALAVVGESGSGKSVTMLAILGMLRGARVTGSARFRGTELIGMPDPALRRVRGASVSMVFQDPMASLNPVLPIGRQLALVMRTHQPGMSKRLAGQRAVELLDRVAIPQPSRRAHQYPHELSGGMRQRVMIAMAIANSPDVLIADEPTTALDVTVQAQIMELLRDLQAEQGLALVLITHDLGVVAGSADRVAVMYAGRVVERGEVGPLFGDPGHPYTRGLLACLPRLDARHTIEAAIPGVPAAPTALPSGCPFHPRCSLAVAACAEAEPVLVERGPTRVACSVTAPDPSVLSTRAVPS